jgi:hypothetical protein
VRASPGDLFVTISGSGPDCLQAQPCDLQTALGMPQNGDTIYIAQGVYTGTGGAVVTVTRSITLYGGWDGSTETPPVRAPETYTSTLDGEGQRRAAYVHGSVSEYIMPTLDGLRLTNGRVSSGEGGGIHIISSDNGILVNSAVVEKRIVGEGAGSGIHVRRSAVRLLHTTIASNRGGDGSGMHVTEVSPFYSTVLLTNSHTVGITAATSSASTAVLDGVLWAGNASANTGGPGTITATNEITGPPAFVDPDGGDYHITCGSAARDNGVAAAVETDVDGDSRVFGAPPDLGADEHVCYVCLNDDTASRCPSVQAAIAASTASTDVVKIAGTCRGVQTAYSHEQVAYVDRALTIRGGYNANFSGWNPRAYPATLDAQSGGRVVYVVGTHTPTLEALHLVNGLVGGFDSGGGIYSFSANPVISACHVYSNTAVNGGGMYLSSGSVLLTGNTIRNDAASSGNGGGVFLTGDSRATMVNNVLARNRLDGAGINIFGSTAYLVHNTLAGNSGGNGAGIHLMLDTTVAATNTILVGHVVGIYASAASATATLTATLWGNDTDWGGDGHVLTGTVNHRGSPAFLDPDHGDYHIGPGSAAVDRGSGHLGDARHRRRVPLHGLGDPPGRRRGLGLGLSASGTPQLPLTGKREQRRPDHLIGEG